MKELIILILLGIGASTAWLTLSLLTGAVVMKVVVYLLNKIYCSSSNNSLYFSKLDKDKYEVLYTYCCCSEIGCRRCSAYKYLKEKSQE